MTTNTFWCLFLGPSDILSVSSLNDKTACQLKAAEFLCYWYKSSVSVVDTDGTVGTSEEGGNKRLGIEGTILSMLSEGNDLKSPVQVQTVCLLTDIKYKKFFYGPK